MEKQPKYQLGQRVDIRSMGINLPAIITKRIKVENVDDPTEVVFKYNFKHESRTIEKPWSWDSVGEEDLDEMIWNAKKYQTHYGKNG
jgi:hypothetical protein